MRHSASMSQTKGDPIPHKARITDSTMVEHSGETADTKLKCNFLYGNILI